MPDTTLLIIAVIALAISDVVLIFLGYMLYALREKSRETQGVSEKDIRALQLSLATLIQRLGRIEADIKDLEGGQPTLSMPENQAYEVAARLIRRGADINELMSVCGLTQGEAELLLNLHGDTFRQGVDKRAG